MTGQNRETVSILIPAFNEERNLPRLLDAIRKDATLAPLLREVLIDVSGSTDRTGEIALQARRGWEIVQVIDVGRRDGLMPALDRLILAATSDLLVRLDADTQFEMGTLRSLVNHFADPTLGIIGPRIRAFSGRSILVNRLSDAEWAIHDRVSRLRPKTTVVQVFRRDGVRLLPDSPLEDVAIQEVVEQRGLSSGYAPEAEVWIMPPSTIRGYLTKRIRIVDQIRSHRARGYALPATAAPGVVVESALTTVRERGTSLSSMLLFFTSEAAARAMSYLRSLISRAPPFMWDPIDGTKEFDWPPTGVLPSIEGAPKHHSVDRS